MKSSYLLLCVGDSLPHKKKQNLSSRSSIKFEEKKRII